MYIVVIIKTKLYIIKKKFNYKNKIIFKLLIKQNSLNLNCILVRKYLNKEFNYKKIYAYLLVLSSKNKTSTPVSSLI